VTNPRKGMFFLKRGEDRLERQGKKNVPFFVKKGKVDFRRQNRGVVKTFRRERGRKKGRRKEEALEGREENPSVRLGEKRGPIREGKKTFKDDADKAGQGKKRERECSCRDAISKRAAKFEGGETREVPHRRKRGE